MYVIKKTKLIYIIRLFNKKLKKKKEKSIEIIKK